jgi:hypothetical protein
MHENPYQSPETRDTRRGPPSMWTVKLLLYSVIPAFAAVLLACEVLWPGSVIYLMRPGGVVAAIVQNAVGRWLDRVAESAPPPLPR